MSQKENRIKFAEAIKLAKERHIPGQKFSESVKFVIHEQKLKEYKTSTKKENKKKNNKVKMI